MAMRYFNYAVGFVLWALLHRIRGPIIVAGAVVLWLLA
jgi:hypothetical protein